MWTDSQRRTLGVIAGVFAISLLVRAGFNRRFISDPQPSVAPRAGELADRIDPNVASFEELVCLPQMGEKRAHEIVAYRQAFVRDHPGRQAFSRAEDLMQVRGIGAATAATFEPHLMFSKPTTRP